MEFEISDQEYELPKSPKNGCSKHCPVNRGPCTFYNPITHYCRTHCTSECLLDTPRSCYIERPKSHITLTGSGRRSRRSEARHRAPSRSGSRISAESSRSRKSRESESYRQYSNRRKETPRSSPRRRGPDELEIVLYVLFVIWLFLITSALLQ